MRLSRRQLLVLAAAPPLLAVAGAGIVATSWWGQPAGEGFRFLSEAEAGILRALTGAAWPPTPACPLDGATCGLDHYLDAHLATLGDLQRDGIRVLLHALDALPLPSHGARLVALARPDQAEVVHGWLSSDLMELRSAVLSVVILTGMGYTSHPDAAATFGALYGCGYGR